MSDRTLSSSTRIAPPAGNRTEPPGDGGALIFRKFCGSVHDVTSGGSIIQPNVRRLDNVKLSQSQSVSPVSPLHAHALPRPRTRTLRSGRRVTMTTHLPVYKCAHLASDRAEPWTALETTAPCRCSLPNWPRPLTSVWDSPSSPSVCSPLCSLVLFKLFH